MHFAKLCRLEEVHLALKMLTGIKCTFADKYDFLCTINREKADSVQMEALKPAEHILSPMNRATLERLFEAVNSSVKQQRNSSIKWDQLGSKCGLNSFKELCTSQTYPLNISLLNKWQRLTICPVLGLCRVELLFLHSMYSSSMWDPLYLILFAQRWMFQY